MNQDIDIDIELQDIDLILLTHLILRLLSSLSYNRMEIKLHLEHYKSMLLERFFDASLIDCLKPMDRLYYLLTGEHTGLIDPKTISSLNLWRAREEHKEKRPSKKLGMFSRYLSIDRFLNTYYVFFI